MASVATVLLVDDDQGLVDLLTFALSRSHFAVISATRVPAVLKLLDAERPDLAVLDVDLGRSSGFDLLREIREKSELPVIMLTGMDTERDKLRGFELGADDYLTKPFSHHELIARLHSQLRRNKRQTAAAAAPAAETPLQVGPITLSVAEHSATKDGHLLHLTVTEFRVLHHLMGRPGTVVSTRELMKQVWGFDDPSGTDAVRVTLHRLRRKLEDDPTRPRLLRTVPGVGVLLQAGASVAS